MLRQSDDVVNPGSFRDLGRSVRAPIVHNEVFDLIDTADLPREITNRERDRPFLIIARDLNDELHQLISQCIGTFTP